MRKSIFTGCRWQLFLGALVVFAAAPVYGQTSMNPRPLPMGDSITADYESTTNNGYCGPLLTALNTQRGVTDFVGSQIDGIMVDPDNEGHSGYRIDHIASLAPSCQAVVLKAL